MLHKYGFMYKTLTNTRYKNKHVVILMFTSLLI